MHLAVCALLMSSSDRQWLYVYFEGQSTLFFIPFPLQPRCAIASALTYRIRGCHSNWLTPPTDSPATPLWPPACCSWRKQVPTETALTSTSVRAFFKNEHKRSMMGAVSQHLPLTNPQIHASSFFPLFLLESVLQKHTAGLFLTNKNEKENRRPDVNTLNSLIHSLSRGAECLWSRVRDQVYQHRKAREED